MNDCGKVSVLMGIYNCETTLRQAVQSILNQTYVNWELIMCDDGSKDKTYSVAKEYQSMYPEKIFVLQNPQNLGLNQTLNNCLEIATGKYIARMDGDDLCSPERFEKELSVLVAEPEISIVSCDMELFDENGVFGIVSHPDYPEYKDFLFGGPFCHAPCLVRKEAFDRVNGYTVDEKLIRVEDYHLWTKMYAAGYRGKNIHEKLYQMRDDCQAYKRRSFKNRLNESYMQRMVVKMLGLPKWYYICSIKPILIGLMPTFIYKIMHRKRLGSTNVK